MIKKITLSLLVSACFLKADSALFASDENSLTVEEATVKLSKKRKHIDDTSETTVSKKQTTEAKLQGNKFLSLAYEPLKSVFRFASHTLGNAISWIVPSGLFELFQQSKTHRVNFEGYRLKFTHNETTDKFEPVVTKSRKKTMEFVYAGNNPRTILTSKAPDLSSFHILDLIKYHSEEIEIDGHPYKVRMENSVVPCTPPHFTVDDEGEWGSKVRTEHLRFYPVKTQGNKIYYEALGDSDEATHAAYKDAFASSFSVTSKGLWRVTFNPLHLFLTLEKVQRS
jgi:hypothetical protein